MAKRTWTAQQLAAIQERNKNILVSAAAGSGKTAVLVERIIQRLTDEENPADIDRMLIVTFTNAAASEMRERIGRALEAALEMHPHSAPLRRQLVLLPNASITTIHSFCLDVLRERFHECGLDPSFRVADPTEAELLLLEAMEQAADELYEDEEWSEAFAELTEGYARTDTALYALAKRIYTFVQSLPEPHQWLERQADAFQTDIPFEQTPICTALLSGARQALDSAVQLLSNAVSLLEQEEGQEKYLTYFTHCLNQITTIRDAADFWDMRTAIQQLDWGRLPTLKKSESLACKNTVVRLRDRARAIINDWKDSVFNLDQEQYHEVIAGLQTPMHCLSAYILRIDDCFAQKKREKNLLDFGDFEHFCLKVLRTEDGRPTPTAQELAARYDEIYIDEYQDTSRIQEAIFDCIKRENNLFMVGDIKQSIYRFRNTDPQLFQAKKQQYTANGARDRKIVLSNNFRSAPGILDCINTIFSRIMSPETGEVDYNEEERLYPGLPYADVENAIERNAELCIIDMQEDETQEDDELPARMELEALLAAQKIKTLMASRCQVMGKDGYRELRWRDIAVLLRSPKGWAEVFGQVLADSGIPCYADVATGFFVTEEVRIVLSMLKVLDNPDQDIPLLSVLRSPIYMLSANELADIRLTDMQVSFYNALQKKAADNTPLGKKAQDILASINHWRKLSHHMKLDELLWKLYLDTGLYEFEATQPGGELRQANLRTLLDRAASFEKTSFKGLYSFVQFIDQYRAGGDFGSAKLLGDEHDVVRILSIHKSKGLEYPVVLLCGLGKRFNLRDLNEGILIDAELGYGPKYVDLERRITCDTPIRQLIYKKKQLEQISEEMRVLYVALTRAREKLILIGAANNLGEKAAQWSMGQNNFALPPTLTGEARSYLDWCGMALMTHPGCEALRALTDAAPPIQENASPWHLELYSKYQLKPEEQEQQQAALPAFDPVLAEDIRQILQYRYPHAGLKNMPGKVTVTELKNLAAPEPDTVYLYPRPLFLMDGKTRLSGAERGNAWHTAMQYMDYHAPDITAELDRLCSAGYLTPAEREAIPAGQLTDFFNSPIGQLLRRADQVEREVMFGITIRVGDLYGDTIPQSADEEPLLLQGVIDCVFRLADKWYILDYKTEHYTSREAVREKYRPQLTYYAIAAQRLYGAMPEGKYLYMFETGETIDMEE